MKADDEILTRYGALGDWVNAQADPMLSVARFLKEMAGALRASSKPVKIIFDFRTDGDPDVTVEWE